jgi:hypothetical protein
MKYIKCLLTFVTVFFLLLILIHFSIFRKHEHKFINSVIERINSLNLGTIV